MSIFSAIKDKIFGVSKAEAAPATAGGVEGSVSTPAAPIAEIDVVAILEDLNSKAKEKLNWRVSIVDLMKLLDLDSSLTARKLGENGRVIVASPAYLARAGTPRTPEDLLDHNCLNFNFRRAEPVWPFVRDGTEFCLAMKGGIEANNGETLGQLAAAGVGVTRVGAFSVAQEIADGRLVPLLEAYNPGDVEQIHAVFVGGPNTPARVRAFVDFLGQRLTMPPARAIADTAALTATPRPM